MAKQHQDVSLSEVHESVDTTSTNKPVWRRIFAFFGPAYLVSVGYMDPGNWATDLAGGSRFGYTLIWVLLMSNLMALLLQSMSARLGIVRRRDLAQANRETYPRPVNFALYILAEVAIAATDLAEVLGMAIGIQLLTGLPLIWGVTITVLDTFLILILQRLGMRKMEAFIVGLVCVIGLSFLVQLVMARPNLGEVATGFIPRIPDYAALYIAIGIIGATVMPHNLYLHSALVQTRKIKRTREGIKKALRLNFADTAIALNLAFFVNAGILILAAAVFYKTGQTDGGDIRNAYKLLPAGLGSEFAASLFAIALIAAGQSSTVTGTLAGQIVMEGYLHLRINPMMRRLLTRMIAIVPAVLVILISGEEEVEDLLIFSQVILSMQLGFAIIPLIHFVSDKKTMGEFAIKRITQIAAWLITVILVVLNLAMVGESALSYFRDPGQWGIKIAIIVATLLFIGLLAIAIIYPLKKKRQLRTDAQLHREAKPLEIEAIEPYPIIAVALDFSDHDQLLISHALGQGHPSTKYVLIHVVESVPARLYEHQSDDSETQKDREHINFYALQLQEKGYAADALIGFGERAKEIVRLVNESGASMLVIGAHGHSGIKDLLYGETINTVRHGLHIPVLVIRTRDQS